MAASLQNATSVTSKRAAAFAISSNAATVRKD
jgi:hypothetical protein